MISKFSFSHTPKCTCNNNKSIIWDACGTGANRLKILFPINMEKECIN